MPAADREFQQKLLATFREEAQEHLGAISRGLIDLENALTVEARAPLIEKMFREAHSLKGAARAVSLKEIETVCQCLEGVFSRAKCGEVELGANALDVMHTATEEVERLLQSTKDEHAPGGTRRTSDLNSRLESIRGNTRPPEGSRRACLDDEVPNLSTGAKVPEKPPKEGPAILTPSAAVTTENRSTADETVRVSADMLDRLLLEVEELVPASMAVAHCSAELRELSRESSQWKREWGKVHVVARAAGESIGRDGVVRHERTLEERKLLDFLEWNEAYVRRVEARLNALTRSSARDQRSLGTMVDSLLHDTKLLLLRPFASLTEAYPKLVRDLCRQQGKDAALVVQGSGIEIDRRILQEIKDPLLHMLRNCVDHGIEKAQERERVGKSPRGAIVIAIELKSANRVEISISDDGSGIDPRRVREAVVKSGHVDAASAQGIGDTEILSYIFQSGVTTSPIITDISGRGLGMAIVREKVEKLGGDVSLETRPGAGTTFRLLLPLTVSTVRGLLVRVGDQRFVIPVTFVERVELTRLDAIQTVENRATVLLGGRPVSFFRLREVLSMPVDRSADKDVKRVPIVVLAAAARRIACQVDEVMGEQELLVKTLGPQLVRVRNIGGAAVLGTGKVIPILNVADLMKSAVRTSPQPTPAPGAAEAPRQRAILVVDDSITARTLFKTILESAGYFVRTAVDGAEAFATLRESDFDVVVSDVDMPRLNGFDLTARIRADRKLADLPVILVTALESRQDRERGIDVGANAYIVKSSFEQSNLLDVVLRYA